MGIQIRHGDPSTIGALAQEAGKAEASQMQAQRDQQVLLQSMQNSARLQSQQMQINAQKEMAEFRSMVDQEAAKRQYAWQVERDDMVRRHDFDMLEQKKHQLFEMSNMKEVQQLNQLEASQQRVEDLYAEGKISDEERTAALLKVTAGYHRTIQKTDPMAEELNRIMMSEEQAELTGKPAINEIDAVQESTNRTALLNRAIASGNTRLAQIASDGDMGTVMKELAKPTAGSKEREVYDIKASYLRTISSTLEDADRVRLNAVLAAGKPEQISKAYKEVIDNLQEKWTTRVKGSPEQVVERGYQTLAEMRRANNEF